MLGLAAARGSAALHHTPQAADPARLRRGGTAGAPAAGAHRRAAHQAAIMILRGIAGGVVPELQAPPDPRAAAAGAGTAAAARFPPGPLPRRAPAAP